MIDALEVKHLTVSFARDPVLWDVSFSVPEGHLTAIVGPNGAGKSTLIKALLGLVPMKSGTVRFLGERREAIQDKIAYIPQRSEIDWNFPITVKEFVLMGCFGRLGLFKRAALADHIDAEKALETVEMSSFASRQIGELSGGQKQRVFIARALMQKATLFLMDEPFQGIDHATEKMLLALFQQFKSEGKSLFIVHHDLNSVASIFDWAVLLNLRLVASGKVADCFNEEMLTKAYGKSAYLFEEAVRKVK